MSQGILNKGKRCFFLLSYFLLSEPLSLSAEISAPFSSKGPGPEYSSKVSVQQTGGPMKLSPEDRQAITDFIAGRKKVHAAKQPGYIEGYLPDPLHWSRLALDCFPPSLQLTHLTPASLAEFSLSPFQAASLLMDEELQALPSFCDDLAAALKMTKDPLPLVDWINLSNMEPFFQSTFHSLMGQEKYLNAIDSRSRYNLAITPYGVRSKFHLDGSDFSLETLGATLSGTGIFKDAWALGGGVGYWHSHLTWGDQMKKGNLNSFYFGPHIGYLFDPGYLDLTLVGVHNSYNVQRELIGAEVTTNKHTGWDLMAKLDGGIDLTAPVLFGPNCFIEPKGNISYLAVWQGGYEEKGSDDSETSLDSRYFDFFRAFLGLDLRKEFHKKEIGFLIPTLGLGGVWMRPISNTKLSLSCETIQDKAYEATAQLYLGAKLTAIHKRGILLSFDFNAFIANLYSSYNGNIRFEVDW